MCLLFFNVNDNCSRDGLRLVLVNNRDESWLRPTKAAAFWPSNQCCISGLDQKPGKEGGTWLGANRHGRIGCLVNFVHVDDPTKKNRGFLVHDFLTTSQSIQSYAEAIHSKRQDYKGFTLALIELGHESGSSVVARVTNDRRAENSKMIVSPSPEDVFAMGNSHVDLPWRKMVEGERRFSEIVRMYTASTVKATTTVRYRLSEKLLQLMADRGRHLPDPQLQQDGLAMGWDRESIESKAAIFVWDPSHHKTTRTTTVVTVTGAGDVDYTEKTLQTPVTSSRDKTCFTCNPLSTPAVIPDTFQWATQQHSFTLLPPHTCHL